EFDFESASKKQLRGNIYLAKVTRVEPSLQAAFIEYGGNRHGFLAFSEIHPDYFKIPVADREAGETDWLPTEPASEGSEGAGIALAAALPEPVAVPAAPEGGEDDTAETETVGTAVSEHPPKLGEAAPISTAPGVEAPAEEPHPAVIPTALPWEDVTPTPPAASEETASAHSLFYSAETNPSAETSPEPLPIVEV